MPHELNDAVLLKSPLHERHIELGAKFAEFGGWSMPLEYAGGGVLAEHAAVRETVGVFDVSHLGKVLLRGAGALDFANTCLTNDLRKIQPGKAQYTLLCNESGGVIDDLIAYIKSDDEIFLIPNASNTLAVVDDLKANAPSSLEIINQHQDFAVIAVQGPASGELLSDLGMPIDLEYMAFKVIEMDGWTMTVCRTGYTGEHGYELVVPRDMALEVFDAVLSAGQSFDIRACGLGARDTLRTEMGYPLHGNDITSEINPVEAGISWAIGWGKEAFHGADALRAVKAAGPNRRMRGLLACGRGIPRHGMSVVRLGEADGTPIGEITSGTFSPTLRQGIALALVDADFNLGDRVGVLVRQRVEEFELVKPPFVQPTVR